MLSVEKLAILQPEIGHTFVLNASNYEDNITKGYEPKLQVQYVEKNEYILGMGIEYNCIDTYGLDDEY